MRAAGMAGGRVGIRDMGKRKRPRGISSGRYSSMIKEYVKEARNVKPFFSLKLTRSAQPLETC